MSVSEMDDSDLSGDGRSSPSHDILRLWTLPAEGTTSGGITWELG